MSHAKLESSSARLSLVKRKDLGAFYTPSELTDFAVGWAVRRPTDVAMDPGCGDAAFLVSVASRLRALGAANGTIPGQIIGIDLNPDALATALEELNAIGIPEAELLLGNFFTFGSLLRPLKQVDALVGNPPYVRYQQFKDDSRAVGLQAAARAGVILPRLSSSWAPYVVHAATFLKPGGRLALVLPGEILHVGYAAAVRDLLLRSFSELTIVTFEEKVFPGALEEVVLVLGVKGQGDGTLRVRRLNALADLQNGPGVVLEKARVCKVEPGQRWLTTLLAEDTITGALDVVERAQFRPLGELGRVEIGVVTGANDYFMLTRETVVEYKLPLSVLFPAISRATHVQGTRFTVTDWSGQLGSNDPAYLLVIPEEEKANANVAKYLAEGEERGVPQRYKCRIREPWYRVPYVKKPSLFLTYMSHVAPRLVVNEAGAAHSNTVHGVFLTDPLLAEPLAAAFLNSATLLSAEIEGRSYGGGVLKLEPGEAIKVLVPKLTPALIESLTKILPAVDALVRTGRIEEASAKVDTIVLKKFKPAERERVRAALSSLRARRFTRGKTS